MGIFDNIVDIPASFKRAHLPCRKITLEGWILKVAIESKDELSDSPSEPFRDTANGQFLGSLQLSIEIFHMICLYIDPPSLHFLKATNSRMRTLIPSLPEHQALVSHASGLLDLVQRTGPVSYSTISRLYNILTCGTCTICGQFAGFVFLLAM